MSRSICAVVVAAILSSCQVRAQDAASARAFVVSIYRTYQNGKGIEFGEPGASLYFHSSLLALEDADVKANGPDYVPAVDYDPLCSCQDWDGIWNFKIELRVETLQRAIAHVSFSLSDPKNNPKDAARTLVITLVPEHDQWRIYDILDKSDPKDTSSLRQILQKDLASLQSHRPSKPH